MTKPICLKGVFNSNAFREHLEGIAVDIMFFERMKNAQKGDKFVIKPLLDGGGVDIIDKDGDSCIDAFKRAVEQ